MSGGVTWAVTPARHDRVVLYSRSMAPLSEMEVLVVDCQATAAAPRGHLLELGWALAGPAGVDARARLIRLPDGTRIPPAVERITGISDSMLDDAADAPTALRELAGDA